MKMSPISPMATLLRSAITGSKPHIPFTAPSRRLLLRSEAFPLRNALSLPRHRPLSTTIQRSVPQPATAPTWRVRRVSPTGSHSNTSEQSTSLEQSLSKDETTKIQDILDFFPSHTQSQVQPRRQTYPTKSIQSGGAQSPLNGFERGREQQYRALVPKEEANGPDYNLPVRLHPFIGRTERVTRNTPLATAMRRLEIRCRLNRIPQDANAQRFHERAGMKRKRLRRQRWAGRFKEGFKARVAQVKQMDRMGW